MLTRPRSLVKVPAFESRVLVVVHVSVLVPAGECALQRLRHGRRQVVQGGAHRRRQIGVSTAIICKITLKMKTFYNVTTVREFYTLSSSSVSEYRVGQRDYEEGGEGGGDGDDDHHGRRHTHHTGAWNQDMSLLDISRKKYNRCLLQCSTVLVYVMEQQVVF